jgi:hypothetical protein
VRRLQRPRLRAAQAPPAAASQLPSARMLAYVYSRRYLLRTAEFLYLFEDALALCVVAGGSQRLGSFLRGGS